MKKEENQSFSAVDSFASDMQVGSLCSSGAGWLIPSEMLLVIYWFINNSLSKEYVCSYYCTQICPQTAHMPTELRFGLHGQPAQKRPTLLPLTCHYIIIIIIIITSPWKFSETCCTVTFDLYAWPQYLMTSHTNLITCSVTTSTHAMQRLC